jgi:hypothetical protein
MKVLQEYLPEEAKGKLCLCPEQPLIRLKLQEIVPMSLNVQRFHALHTGAPKPRCCRRFLFYAGRQHVACPLPLAFAGLVFDLDGGWRQLCSAVLCW